MKFFVHSIGQSSSLNQIPIDYVGYIRMVKRTQLEDRITIDDYLTVFGAQGEFNQQELPAQLDQKLYELGEKWASGALELGPGLATLNYLATTCRKEQKTECRVIREQQGYRELNMLLSDLVEAKIASYSDGVLTFANEDARYRSQMVSGWKLLFIGQYATFKEKHSNCPRSLTQCSSISSAWRPRSKK